MSLQPSVREKWFLRLLWERRFLLGLARFGLRRLTVNVVPSLGPGERNGYLPEGWRRGWLAELMGAVLCARVCVCLCVCL